MSAPKSVLFDLGNVLVHFQPERFWDALGVDDEARRLELKPRMLELGRTYEAGRLSTEEFRSRFRELFPDVSSDQDLDNAFLAVLPEPVNGMERLVQKVAARCETGLVSNTNPIHFDLCLRTMPVLKHIDRFYVSYEIGALKPDKVFYGAVTAGERFRAEEMVFVDDLAENIEAAEREGFVGIRFSGSEDLEQKLAGLGIV